MPAVQLVEVFYGLLSIYVARHSAAKHSNEVILIQLFGSTLCAVVYMILDARASIQAIATGIMCVFGLSSPVAATGSLLGTVLLRPWELLEVGQSWEFLPLLLAGIAVLSLSIAVICGRYPLLRVNNFTIVFLLMNLWFLLSSLVSTSSEASLDYLFERMPIVIVIIFLLNTVIISLREMRFLQRVIVLSVLGVVSCAMAEQLTTEGLHLGSRLTGRGMWGNSNDIAALIVFATPFLFIPFGRDSNENDSFRLRFLRLSIITVLLCALWWCQSRGAILGMAAALLAFGGLLVGKSIRKKLFIWCLILMASIFIGSHLHRDNSEMQTSRSARWNYVIAGVRMAVERPFLGVGISQYPALYERYTPAFEEWGERTAHSSWILALAESGFIGSSLFSLLYIIVCIHAWHIRAFAPNFVSSVIGYGIVMTFLSHTYQLLPYLLGICVVLAARLKQYG